MSDDISLGTPDNSPGRDKLPPACAAVDDDLTELALGALAGKRRVLALAHIEHCARCDALVEQLSSAADELLHLAPEAEPPAGFEAMVFERLGILAPPASPWRARRERSRPRISLLPAVAAATLIVAFGLGTLTGRATKPGYPAERPPMELASLVSHGRDMGRVYVYAGNPTWLFMVISGTDWQGTLRCEVMMDNGPPEVLGQFWLSDGKGAWAQRVDAPAGRLREAKVLSASGKVLASAILGAN